MTGPPNFPPMSTRFTHPQPQDQKGRWGVCNPVFSSYEKTHTVQAEDSLQGLQMAVVTPGPLTCYPWTTHLLPLDHSPVTPGSFTCYPWTTVTPGNSLAILDHSPVTPGPITCYPWTTHLLPWTTHLLPLDHSPVTPGPLTCYPWTTHPWTTHLLPVDHLPVTPGPPTPYNIQQTAGMLNLKIKKLTNTQGYL
ncbi:hypothetical protein BsWGS_15962 [Bradybaena similaris]